MEMNRLAEERAVTGADVLHLEVGRPAAGTPRGVRDAVVRAVDKATLGYTTALGLPQLHARIAAHYADWYAVDVDPSRVIVTAGASGGFVLALLRVLRRRRPSWSHRTGLPVLSQHARRARRHTRRHSGRRGDPMRADSRTHRRRRPSRRSRHRQPVESHRHRDPARAAHGDRRPLPRPRHHRRSPTRSTTASPTARPRPARSP